MVGERIAAGPVAAAAAAATTATITITETTTTTIAAPTTAAHLEVTVLVSDFDVLIDLGGLGQRYLGLFEEADEALESEAEIGVADGVRPNPQRKLARRRRGAESLIAQNDRAPIGFVTDDPTDGLRGVWGVAWGIWAR